MFKRVHRFSIFSYVAILDSVFIFWTAVFHLFNIETKNQFMTYFVTKQFFALAIFNWIIFGINFYVFIFDCYQEVFIVLVFIWLSENHRIYSTVASFQPKVYFQLCSLQVLYCPISEINRKQRCWMMVDLR